MLLSSPILEMKMTWKYSVYSVQDSCCHLLQLTGLKYSTSFVGELLRLLCKRPSFSSSYDHSIEPHNSLELRHPSNGKYMFFSRSDYLCSPVVQQLWPRRRGTFQWSFFPSIVHCKKERRLWSFSCLWSVTGEIFVESYWTTAIIRSLCCGEKCSLMTVAVSCLRAAFSPPNKNFFACIWVEI